MQGPQNFWWYIYVLIEIQPSKAFGPPSSTWTMPILTVHLFIQPSCNNYQLWASSAYGCSKSSLSSSYLIKSNLIRFYIFFLIWFRLLCMWLHNRAFDCSESSRFSSLASLTGSPDAKDQTLQRSISIALCKQTLITLLGTIRNKNMVTCQRAGQ